MASRSFLTTILLIGLIATSCVQPSAAVLEMIGFGAGGIVKGSVAATLQSMGATGVGAGILGATFGAPVAAVVGVGAVGCYFFC
ncbi:unnamed protein product [Orchesella dallaii]|uniref:Uncharacterized protein n=1 Tax=Orchesella dallaii TaxID=48710 RepID=A0ABP1S427_9HEXA